MTAEQFELLKQKSQPHQVFKLDWSSYYSIDYADIFLPKVQGYRAKALRLYDGGEFFKELRKTDRKVLAFKYRTDLHTLISYSYPKGTLAQERKNIVQVDRHEVCTFIEFDQQENIDVTFKFGSDFKRFVDQLYQEKKINSAAIALENNTYNTTINEFRSHFKEGLVHDTMMRFVLNTMDIPVDEVVSVAPIYPKAVFDYIVNYKVQDKYPVRILYRASQRQVLDDRKTTKPANDTIHVWLVREDLETYDEDFIIIDLGIDVANYYREKGLTANDLSIFIKETLRDRNLQGVIESEEIDESTRKSLAIAFGTIKLLDKVEREPTAKEVFKSDAFAFLVLELLGFASQKIKYFKIDAIYWDPKADGYIGGFITSDSIENAFFCGVINGFIDELAGIADAIPS